jgi:anaerobic sulfite reductase subunit B
VPGDERVHAWATARRRYMVVDRQAEGGAGVSLRLRPLGSPIPAPAPGQYCELAAPGCGPVPAAISALPTRAEPALRVTVALPEVASAMPGLVPPRPPRRQRRVWVRGPLGTGWDLEPAVGGDLLLVAGGDGLASLLPVLADAVDYPGRHPRAVLLLPAGQPSDMPFRAALAAWPAPPSRRLVTVTGGRTGEALAGVRFNPGRCLALVSDGLTMAWDAGRALRGAGVPARRIQVSFQSRIRCRDGSCGRCRVGGLLPCRDGPVIGYDRLAAT